MSIKKFFSFSLVFALISCHQFFNNVADPKSKNYIGYPLVLGENKTIPLSPKKGETILFPAFEWLESSLPSFYFLQLYQSNEGGKSNLIFEQSSLDVSFLGMVSYNEKKGWALTPLDKKLSDLPFGRYFWRVNVQNELTNDQLGAWSHLYPFEVAIRLKEIYWKYDVDSHDAVKQGFLFFPDQKKSWERELPFIQRNGSPAINYFDLELNQYNEKGEILLKKIYTSNEPSEEAFFQQFVYHYDRNKRGEKINSKKILVADKAIFLVGPKVMEECEYFYEKPNFSSLVKMNTYRFNEDTGEKILYSTTEWEKGKQKGTFYFKKNSTTEEMEIVYYYLMEYYEKYPTKPKIAKYYLKNKDTQEMVHYNDYIFEYNFPEEKEGEVILNRGNCPLLNFDNFSISEKEIAPPVAIE